MDVLEQMLAWLLALGCIASALLLAGVGIGALIDKIGDR